MINVEMTVREALNLVSNGVHMDMYERIVQALEAKCGELKAIMTVRYVPRDSFIPCIKIIRNHLGWGLKDTKDFLDIVRGGWSSDENDYVDGKPNSLTNDSDVIIKIASELRSQGCTVDVKDSERKSL
jgi:ribosomal protein L7/L12